MGNTDTIGARIKKLLLEKDLTQKELADKVGCTEAAISHYIKGDRVPRSSVLSSIASVLGTSSDYLSKGIPINSTEEISYAKKLIARNASQMSISEKREILAILMGDDDE